jgi:hypothetical protein
MAAGEQARLATELELYAFHKSEWLRRYPRQYVVIKDEKVLNFFPTFEAAYRAGASEFGLNVDFLVKQIVEQEPIFFVF